MDSLNEVIEGTEIIKIIVSFFIESGVKLIEESLRSALHRGAKIQIITATYLGITEPTALYSLCRKDGKSGYLKGNSFIRKDILSKVI